MSRRSWIRHPLTSFKAWLSDRRLHKAANETKSRRPLREFVYLDTVSLHSLLVSQNATIPHEVSQAISRADEAELSGSVGTKLGSELIGGAAQLDSSARYQTSNSNSTQSSRKAVIQTLFKELRELPLDFKLSEDADPPTRINDVPSIATINNPRAVEAGDAFMRGTLIEVEVTLAVDPVFKLGSMMTEWSAMADEFPAMFGSVGLLGFLRDSEPIMRVLDRFLAGLIPIKATATNHVVVEVEGREYIVHKTSIEGLEVDTHPLHIAGVTEHIGYWKDIRRVLFSGARFTILARVARDNIQNSWTPVKLADLFSEIAPGFVDQINAIRSPTASDSTTGSQLEQQIAFDNALEAYKTALLPEDADWKDADRVAFARLKSKFASGATDASRQRRAFDEIRDLLVARFGIVAPKPKRDLKVRQECRASAGLELFPSFAIDATSRSGSNPPPIRPAERLLDTEIIAIYW